MKIKQILVCCFVMLAMPANAADIEAYTNQGTNAKVLFVLDASGSMLRTESGDVTSNFDETRMKTLNNALEAVINELGDTQRLQFGLTWFGGLTPGGIKLPMRPLTSPASDLYNINYSDGFSGDEITFGELFLNTVRNIYATNEYDGTGYDIENAGLYDRKALTETEFNITSVPACTGFRTTIGQLRADVNTDPSIPGGFADDFSTSGEILPLDTDRPYIWTNSGGGTTPWPMSSPPSDSDSIPATWVQTCPNIPAVCDRTLAVASVNADGNASWDPDQCQLTKTDGSITAVDQFMGHFPICTVGETVQVFGCLDPFLTLLNDTTGMQTPTVDALFEAARYFRGDKVFFGTRDHFPFFDEEQGRYFDALESSTYTWPGGPVPASNNQSLFNRTGIPANTEFFGPLDGNVFADQSNLFQNRYSGPLATLGWRAVNRAALTSESRDQIREYIPTEFWTASNVGVDHNVFEFDFEYRISEASWNLFLSSIHGVNLLESPYTDFQSAMAAGATIDELSELDREGGITIGGVAYENIAENRYFDCNDPAPEELGFCSLNTDCPAEGGDPDCEPVTFTQAECPPDKFVVATQTLRECSMRFQTQASYESPVDECSNQAIILISDGLPTANFVDNGQPLYNPLAMPGDYVFNNINFTTPGLIRRMIQNSGEENYQTGPNTYTPCEQLFPGAAAGTLEHKTNIFGGCGPELTSFLANHSQVPGRALGTVNTHAIGFNVDGIGQTFLRSLTDAGKGVYADASDGDELVSAIENMISLAQVSTAEAPSLVINLDNSSLTTENIVYTPVFKASGHSVWAANVKAYFLNPEYDENGFERPTTQPYGIDGLRSFWSNENTLVIPDDVEDPLRFTTLHGGLNTYLFQDDKNVYPRNIYLEKEEWSGNGPFGKAYKVGHPGQGPTAEYLGIEDASLSESENEAAVDELMHWFERTPLGDMLHSKPTLVSYSGSHTLPDGSVVNDPRILYVVSNRGLLHAFDVTGVGSDIEGSGQSFINSANAPKELGAWMPHSLVTRIHDQSIAEWGSGHIYGLDGEIRTWREPVTEGGVTTFNTYLLLGMRRGGEAYYKIDITQPGQFDVDWRVDSSTAGFENIGQTWSPMAVMKLKWPSDEDKYVGVVGGGYDEIDDVRGTSRLDTTGGSGANLYLIDMDDGSLIASVGGAESGATYQNEDMKWGIPSEIRIIDANGDGYADRLYYGDMGGQLWRTDVSTDGETSNATLTNNVLLDAGGDAPTGHRRIYEPPAVAFLTSGEIAVAVTTGYRAHPLNGSTIDPATGERYPVIQDTVAMVKDLGNYPLQLADLTNVTNESVTLSGSAPGWRIVLREPVDDPEDPAQWAGEKVLSEPVVFNNRLLFTTLLPSAGAEVCSVTGTENRFYSINLYNGRASGDLTDAGESGGPDGVTEVGDPVRFTTLNSSNVIESELAISVESTANGCTDGKSCGDFYVGTQAVGKYELTPGKIYWKETSVVENDPRFE